MARSRGGQRLPGLGHSGIALHWYGFDAVRRDARLFPYCRRSFDLARDRRVSAVIAADVSLSE